MLQLSCDTGMDYPGIQATEGCGTAMYGVCVPAIMPVRQFWDELKYLANQIKQYLPVSLFSQSREEWSHSTEIMTLFVLLARKKILS